MVCTEYGNDLGCKHPQTFQCYIQKVGVAWERGKVKRYTTNDPPSLSPLAPQTKWLVEAIVWQLHATKAYILN